MITLTVSTLWTRYLVQNLQLLLHILHFLLYRLNKLWLRIFIPPQFLLNRVIASHWIAPHATPQDLLPLRGLCVRRPNSSLCLQHEHSYRLVRVHISCPYSCNYICWWAIRDQDGFIHSSVNGRMTWSLTDTSFHPADSDFNVRRNVGTVLTYDQCKPKKLVTYFRLLTKSVRLKSPALACCVKPFVALHQ
jgi:hypothetical protein